MHRDDSSVFETLSSPVGVLVCEARTLQYGFYTASELRKLSVVQVTSKEQRDALNRPLPQKEAAEPAGGDAAPAAAENEPVGAQSPHHRAAPTR